MSLSIDWQDPPFKQGRPSHVLKSSQYSPLCVILQKHDFLSWPRSLTHLPLPLQSIPLPLWHLLGSYWQISGLFGSRSGTGIRHLQYVWLISSFPNNSVAISHSSISSLQPSLLLISHSFLQFLWISLYSWSHPRHWSSP